MLVSKHKKWFRVTAVEHQKSVIEMIKAFLPQAKPHHFSGVLVDGQEVTPVSVPPGLHRIVISCDLNMFEIRASLPGGLCCLLECDITTRGIDLLRQIEASHGFHSSCIKLMCGSKPVDPYEPILASGVAEFQVRCEASVTLPADLPVVQLPCGLPFPPDHSDLSVAPIPEMLRVAARHPVWSSVRTVTVHCETTVQKMLGSLFPDTKSTCCMKLSCAGKIIDGETKVSVLNTATGHEVAFENTKSFPVAAIEFVMPSSIVDQMKIGTSDWAGADPTKRWIRSPFQTKAYEKTLPKKLTLTNLAAQYMAHSSSAIPTPLTPNFKGGPLMYIFSWGGGRVENVLGTPPTWVPEGGGVGGGKQQKKM